MIRVFATGARGQGSIPGRDIPKTHSRNATYASQLSAQHYKVQIKVNGAIQKKNERPPLHLGVVTIEKGDFRTPLTMVGQLICTYRQACTLLDTQY